MVVLLLFSALVWTVGGRRTCYIYGRGYVKQFNGSSYQITAPNTYILLGDNPRVLIYANFAACYKGACLHSLTLYSYGYGARITRGLTVQTRSDVYSYPNYNNTSIDKYKVFALGELVKIDYREFNVSVIWDGTKYGAVTVGDTTKDWMGLCSITTKVRTPAETPTQYDWVPVSTAQNSPARDAIRRKIQKLVLCRRGDRCSVDFKLESYCPDQVRKTEMCRDFVDKIASSRSIVESSYLASQKCDVDSNVYEMCRDISCDGGNVCDVAPLIVALCLAKGESVSPTWWRDTSCFSRSVRYNEETFYEETGVADKEYKVDLAMSDPRSNKCAMCSKLGTLFCDETMGCFCVPLVEGDTCNICKDGYYGEVGYCAPCNCDPEGAYNSTTCDKHTGQCLCRKDIGHPILNRRTCEICRSGTYHYHGKCRKCRCGRMAVDNNCDRLTGRCTCLEGVRGMFCRSCKRDYHGFVPGVGCSSCNCNTYGTISRSTSCSSPSGQCHCKPDHRYYNKKTCDGCPINPSYPFFNYIDSKTLQCTACKCKLRGSLSIKCDLYSGKCLCRPGYMGFSCDTVRCSRSEWSGWNTCHCGYRTRTRVTGPPNLTEVPRGYKVEDCSRDIEVDYEPCQDSKETNCIGDKKIT